MNQSDGIVAYTHIDVQDCSSMFNLVGNGWVYHGLLFVPLKSQRLAANQPRTNSGLNRKGNPLGFGRWVPARCLTPNCRIPC